MGREEWGMRMRSWGGEREMGGRGVRGDDRVWGGIGRLKCK